MAAPFLWAACAEPVEARQFNFVEGFAVLLRRKILRLYMKNRAMLQSYSSTVQCSNLKSSIVIRKS